MKQLEDETGMTLRKFEVWYNDDNLRLLQRLDKVRATRITMCKTVADRYAQWKSGRTARVTVSRSFTQR